MTPGSGGRSGATPSSGLRCTEPDLQGAQEISGWCHLIGSLINVRYHKDDLLIDRSTFASEKCDEDFDHSFQFD